MSIVIPGRPTQSATLNALITQWQKGIGSVVFVSGEPGSGKSFLLDTLQKHLGDQAVRVDCRQPIGTLNVASVQPLQPFGLAIESLYQNGEQVAKKRLALNIGMSLLASLPIAGDIFYAIKAVRQDVTEYKRETAALLQKRKAAVEECVEALDGVAAHTPFVLLVDAAHWSDPQSLEVLKRIAANPQNKLLIVWAFDQRLAREHNLALTALPTELASTTQHIVLDSIDSATAESVLHAIAPSLKLTGEQVGLLNERCGGLPGVMVEYVRYLERMGEISSDGHLRTDSILTSGVQLGAHPSTDVLLHEIQEDDAISLAMGAIEGREFSAFMFAALTNTDVVSAARSLRRLQQRTGMIESIGVRTRYNIKTTTYRFTSDLAFTYFYHYVSYEERKALHHRIAEILTKEHDAADLQATREQLAAIIAAHGHIAEDVEITQRMLKEVDPALAVNWPEADVDTAPVDVDGQPSTVVVADGATVDADESIRLACDALIMGQPTEAQLHTQRARNHPALTTTERITLLCLEARACVSIGMVSEAEQLLKDAEVLSTNLPALRALVLNGLATVAQAQNNVDQAMSMLQEAARINTKTSSSMHVLTACNALILERHGNREAPAITRKLRDMLHHRHWTNLARDLGLGIVIVLMVLSGSVAKASDNDHRARKQSMERAHPTPDPTNLHPDWPKVPFVQGLSWYASQFENVSLIAEEQDQQPMQNESSIAVNPLNPRNLIGSAVDYRANSQTWAYYSTDGANTWHNVKLGYPHEGWRSTNDPSVCFDHQGRGYLCYGGFNVGQTPQFGENGVYISITDDGGLTWGPTHIPVIEHLGKQTADSAFEDKYYVHADTASSSPFRGNLYIPWKRVINADSSTQIVISRSTDRGLSWSVPIAVGARFPHTSEHATFGQSFPLARTGPDGSVHVVWNSGTENAVRYARSTDGGVTFSEPRILHTYNPFGEKLEIEGTVNSRVKGTVRAEAYPSLSVDNTGGARNGRLYLVWSADNPPNVYSSYSADNGTTWSTPRVVHSDTSNDQFWPWIAIDPTTGDVAVMYFDSRDDESNILVNCYVSLSTDGGQTWTDRRVGDADNDLRNNPFSGRTFAGDYSGCDFYNGIVYPSWVDMRNTTSTNTVDSDVYTAIVNTRSPRAPDTMWANTIAAMPTSIDVGWSAVSSRTFGQPLSPAAQYALFRDGMRIATLPVATTSYRDTALTSYREYTYTLHVEDGTDTSATRTASAFAGGSKLPGSPTLVNVMGYDSNDVAYHRVTLTMPRFRLDGETPLVNLAQVLIARGADTAVIAVSASDTGKTVSFVVAAPEDGFWKVRAAIRDADKNMSPFSDSMMVYAGNMEWRQETFDTMPNYYVMGGQWGLDSRLSYSPPTSLSDSPNQDYTRSARDTVLLYPFQQSSLIPENNAIVLRWRVAAFVDPTDTAYLEVKRSGEQSHDWQTIAWWNSSVDPRWADTTKGADAWRAGQHVFDYISPDTLQLRLRFRSNLTKHSDGLYVDDVTWEYTSDVDLQEPHTTSVYPQPASDHVLVGLSNDAPITSCTIQTLAGNEIVVPWYQRDHSLIVDVRGLSSGVYVVRAQTSTTPIQATIVVVN